MKASAVILTRNPGPRFASVLDRVLEQDCPWPFEVLVLDTGSTDGTVEYVQSRPGARLHTIVPDEFGHGRTRNLAVSLTSGEFVAFLTHDALPFDGSWLRRLVEAVEQAPNIAGAFGRHVAYQDASPFTSRDLDQQFARFLEQPLVVSRDLDPRHYATDRRWQEMLRFYSDNNSCLRRSVWEQIPYPDVDFAEDQAWAERIIRAGFAKAYAPDAVVYHSHDYGVIEQFQRSFDEAAALRALFGHAPNANPLRAVLSVGWHVRRDILFAWRERIGTLPAMKRLALDVAYVGGHIVGAHATRLPKSVRNTFSRDKSLHRGVRPATHRWPANAE